MRNLTLVEQHAERTEEAAIIRLVFGRQHRVLFHHLHLRRTAAHLPSSEPVHELFADVRRKQIAMSHRTRTGRALSQSHPTLARPVTTDGCARPVF